ncbi:uncharacterized protein LOC129235632 [Anastrepha obliqua]|uniref:uncharacterized protein LOC129235632 n=1 Tax=Anastrepha obliqua TaxID=95512 RepID=UPI0024097D7A|nr:uncharacterized protein LOC129235632 [Anastrepha obliqua]XP_054725553.1 uncharacterized protein LOC129235632 [Anastrepha obliqua]
MPLTYAVKKLQGRKPVNYISKRKSSKMKVFQVLFSLMLALLLVAPTIYAEVYTVPTAAPTPPTITTSTAGSNDGPPSVSLTEKAASVSTSIPLYGTTAKSS